MAHESFEDEQAANVLNQSYIAVKVDREERPDIDAVYMSVCQSFTGSGGWPLTILMTPDQKPFYAGTYFPKRSGYGRYGLIEILETFAECWKEDRERLLNMGNQLTQMLLQEDAGQELRIEPPRELFQRAFSWYQKNFDDVWGGFGMAPKFPASHNLLFLLRYAVVQREGESLAMAEKTLKQMFRGGIYDHIGGGFSRYSTDEKWLVPHFEKMLYDNALLILTYLEAFLITRNPFYAEVSKAAIRYVLRELKSPEGGFYCGQDADSDGVEGKYYLFTKEEIKEVLKESAPSFCQWFDITEEGNFEGKNIVNLLQNKNFDQKNTEINKACQILYDYRLKRTALHRDDKILTSWNGWLIAALAKAGRIFDDPVFVECAVRAEEFIRRNLINKDGRLLLRWRQGEAANDGQLEDYACYAFALLELYRTTFDAACLKQAVFIGGEMQRLFFDEKYGGFYLYAADGEQLIHRPKETYDGAIPSGNSVAACVLWRLWKLTGNIKWQEAAQKQWDFLQSHILNYPAGSSFALLALLEKQYPGSELVIAAPNSQAAEKIKQKLNHEYIHGLTVIVKDPENEKLLGELVPFTKEYPIPSKETACYLCRNGTCFAPVFSEKEFVEMWNRVREL